MHELEKKNKKMNYILDFFVREKLNYLFHIEPHYSCSFNIESP